MNRFLIRDVGMGTVNLGKCYLVDFVDFWYLDELVGHIFWYTKLHVCGVFILVLGKYW
jgi:hypothetical protein